jgi:hypothetical protein
MIKRIALSAVCLLAAACCFGQATPPSAITLKSDEILGKIQKVDLYHFLLPLAMKKEQYAKLLPVIEKIRVSVRKVQEEEADSLRKLEAEVDEALKDAKEKGLTPKKELRDKLGATFRSFSKRREVSAALNVDLVYDVLKETWNAGQMKLAATSLNPKDYDPNAKVEEMKDEEKVRIFIREIVLNPAAYDVLVQLSQKG